MDFYTTLLVIALASTYLGFYRYEIHVELTLLVALSAWSMLIVEAGERTMIHGGETIIVSSTLIQALSLFMTALCAFAFVGALFDAYPTDKMKSMKHDNYETNSSP